VSKKDTFAFFGEKFSKITYKGYFHAKNRLHASKKLENASQTVKYGTITFATNLATLTFATITSAT
jgi:hypothetical protein